MRRQRWTVDDLDAWYREHNGWLRKVAARLLGDASLAEDVVHEAFIRAWIARDRLESHEHIGPWLHRTTRNLCVDAHRRSSHQLAASVIEIAGSGDDPAALVEARLAWADIVACLRSLNERQRRALVMRTEGMSYSQLGAELGITAVGARAVVNRARQTLRLRLQEAGHSVAGLWIWMQHRGRSPQTSEAVGAGIVATATTIAALFGGSSHTPDVASPRRPQQTPPTAVVAQAPPAATQAPVVTTAPAADPATTPETVPPAPELTATEAPAPEANKPVVSLSLASRSTDPSAPELRVPLAVNLSAVSLSPLLTLRIGP